MEIRPEIEPRSSDAKPFPLTIQEYVPLALQAVRLKCERKRITETSNQSMKLKICQIRKMKILSKGKF